jgi:phosphatidylserine/phosphatidylglycerophosphate/cardiolipin synthase-like enzyme
MDAIVGSDFVDAVVPLLAAAKNSIDIVVFDWRWFPSELGSPVMIFNQAVLAAARRGVVVRAIVNNLDVLNTLKKNGVDAKKLNTSKLVHTKLIICDHKEVVIGSHNYTASAFEMNLELSAHLTLSEADNDFQKYFNKIWLL